MLIDTLKRDKDETIQKVVLQRMKNKHLLDIMLSDKPSKPREDVVSDSQDVIKKFSRKGKR